MEEEKKYLPKKWNKKIIIISIIFLLIIISIFAIIISKNTKSNTHNQNLIMADQEEGIKALKHLYEDNYVTDISQINVYSMYYSTENNLIFIGSKINGNIVNCLYDCKTSTFTYAYTNVLNEYPTLLNAENSFAKTEIQFMINYMQGNTNDNSFYKLITDSIAYDMETLKKAYNEVNDIFSKYYTNQNALSTFLAKYYNNTNVASSLNDSKLTHSRIEKQLNFISNKSNIKSY